MTYFHNPVTKFYDESNITHCLHWILVKQIDNPMINLGTKFESSWVLLMKMFDAKTLNKIKFINENKLACNDKIKFGWTNNRICKLYLNVVIGENARVSQDSYYFPLELLVVIVFDWKLLE